MKIVSEGIQNKFPFEKCCRQILSVLPSKDIAGIQEIRFVNKFTHTKSDPEALATYLKDGYKKSGKIEINFANLKKHKIPEYLFESHPEIAALFLSEIISHEIGHHAHHYHRHGVKKKRFEDFSAKYAKAGYFSYLRSRSKEILSSYRYSSLNILAYDKDARKKFEASRQGLIDWLNQHKEGIKFP
ncbi:MAG: hypothetical protein H8D96_13120 [Desulfobacterales bacterium]|uniref:Uncharacterized protein n=1 Tax=Candidatus Desulfatibia vada TaxID=2841696 RepID=A0A8J6TMS0_9BACT|nr:hypothetical protein [Candidatus Desulfatibia vada]